MVGYAASADDNLRCDNITVTVLGEDDCFLGSAEEKKEIYIVDRSFSKVKKTLGKGENSSVGYLTIIKIAKLLHSEEIKHSCACRIRWRSSDMSYVEIEKSELIGSAWLPTPLFIDNCQEKCVNITPNIFDGTPKPLCASIVCDTLNLIIDHTDVALPHSFFNCMNSVFCSEKAKAVFMYILGGDVALLSDSIHLSGKFKRFLHRIDIQKQVIEPLSYFISLPSSHMGDYLSALVDAKKIYFSKVCEDFVEYIKSQSGWQSFCTLLSKRTSEFIDTLIDMSQIFVVSENINSISDIHYLTIYELQNAFAFFEARFALKTKVRHNRLRQRMLNKLSVPSKIGADITI